MRRKLIRYAYIVITNVHRRIHRDSRGSIFRDRADLTALAAATALNRLAPAALAATTVLALAAGAGCGLSKLQPRHQARLRARRLDPHLGARRCLHGLVLRHAHGRAFAHLHRLNVIAYLQCLRRSTSRAAEKHRYQQRHQQTLRRRRHCLHTNRQPLSRHRHCLLTNRQPLSRRRHCLHSRQHRRHHSF